MKILSAEFQNCVETGQNRIPRALIGSEKGCSHGTPFEYHVECAAVELRRVDLQEVMRKAGLYNSNIGE